jgi:hypothetical protein
MFIKVEWQKPNEDGHTMYNVWEASEYFVEFLGWSGSGGINVPTVSGPSQVRLMLDSSKHDIILSNGDTAFVMNDTGKTIDIIRTI